jgi:hypothetical protein
MSQLGHLVQQLTAVDDAGGAWIGEVTRVGSAGKVWVKVPRYTGPDAEVGPCDVLLPPDLQAESGGDPAHAHEVRAATVTAAYPAGTRVLVAALENEGEDVVVLGRLQLPASAAS